MNQARKNAIVSVLAFLLCVNIAESQIPEARFKDLHKDALITVENFVSEVTSKYDSLGLSKDKGVLIIEFTNVNVQNFPVGFVSQLDSLMTCVERKKIGFEMRISMVMDKRILRQTPSFYCQLNKRPVLIYGGFENFLLTSKGFSKAQKDQVERFLDGENQFIATWLVEVDVFHDHNILVKKKLVGY